MSAYENFRNNVEYSEGKGIDVVVAKKAARQILDEMDNRVKAIEGQGYEYAVQWTEIGTDTKLESEPYFWYTEKEARGTLANYNEQAIDIEANGGKMYYTGEIVKRRKAGKPGKVEKV